MGSRSFAHPSMVRGANCRAEAAPTRHLDRHPASASIGTLVPKWAYCAVMTRISFPDRGFGEYVDWSLLRPKMAAGMGALSEAVYGNSRLPVREREAARWTIALINDCAVCRDTRAKEGPAAGVDESFYEAVAEWRSGGGVLTDRERLAAEFAQRFALDHLAMDDDLWGRLHDAFDDGELADLVICCSMFLGLGRALAVVGVRAPDERILV